mmetsp:Transcript_77132/g.145369  ORF Transcript_77132/g.145369 Transcript_77132/m.145369 type:complete len:339 (-) Transcript_77132:91-1107(-)
MGQTESAGEGAAPTTPPEVEVSRRRQDYLHRLGIQKDGKAFHHVPVTHTEAPGLLESGPEGRERLRTFSSFSTKGADSNEAGGEADSAAPAEASGDGVRVFEMNTLDLRSQDDFRVSFLRKLSYEKVWVPKAQRPPKHQTVIIFDWDDTLLPSAWLLQQGLHPSKPEMPSWEQRAQLKDLCRCVRRTLRHAKSYGTVVLVTNAERGWIELSCQRYFPGLLPMLESVKIVSARAAHEKPGVTSPTVWKSLAFASEINNVFNAFPTEQRKNVISFGDAWHERSAVLEVTKHIPNCCTKSFKFMERPDVAQLRREHDLISGCLGHIVSHEGSLDLRVQCPP